MRTTIDSAGRIVVPKALREELALYGGQVLEVMARDGHLEIDVPPTPMRLEERGGVKVAVTDVPLPPLRQDLVRETLERIRR
ncbi:MAG: antitoxin [Anaerolinea sp.]|jgi:AbrB family looped-hinge helix DNA binding protein|nr:antitoxin [Anaerolinea sp.]